MIQDMAIIFRHTDNLAFNPISSKRAEVPAVNTPLGFIGWGAI